MFHEATADYENSWRRAPRRQYVISLAGGISITASDGETRHIGVGEVVLVEDTAGKGHITKSADVVYDPVGGDAFDRALRAVNWEARMLVIGFAAGRIQTVPANLILVKNISVIGVIWGAQAERDPALISRNLAELLPWWETGRLKPLVAKIFPLLEASEALTALLSRRYAGKIVLET